MSGSKSRRHSRTERERRPNSGDRQTRPRNEGHGSFRKGPAGIIFMCNTNTKRDCFHYKVFGLPISKRDLVEQVAPGTLLFLFDFDVKQLYGIYEAVSWGGMNLEPEAFKGQGSYPAQVKFDVYQECSPLTEDEFKDAIRENYYARNKFKFELSSRQIDKLLRLFHPIEPPYKRINLSNEFELHRQNLLNRSAAGLQPLELVHHDVHHRMPHEVLPIEERNGMHVPIMREDTHLRAEMVGKSHLPPMNVLGDRARTGLLNQGYMNEVDQLALKYLQQRNPIVDSSLDPYPRNGASAFADAAVPGIGLVSRLRQDTMHMAQRDAVHTAQEDAIRRAQEDVLRRAQEDAIRRSQEDLLRRAQEDAIRRAQEVALLRAHQEATLSARTLDSEQLRSATSSRVVSRHASNLTPSSLRPAGRVAGRVRQFSRRRT